jgi:hypothetical protein
MPKPPSSLFFSGFQENAVLICPPHVCYMLYQSHLPSMSSYLVKSTNYETPHYANFSSLLSLITHVQIQSFLKHPQYVFFPL